MCTTDYTTQSSTIGICCIAPERRRTQFTCDFKCEMIQIDFFFSQYVRATAARLLAVSASADFGCYGTAVGHKVISNETFYRLPIHCNKKEEREREKSDLVKY